MNSVESLRKEIAKRQSEIRELEIEIVKTTAEKDLAASSLHESTQERLRKLDFGGWIRQNGLDRALQSWSQRFNSEVGWASVGIVAGADAKAAGR